jgi:hypothetical protein
MEKLRLLTSVFFSFGLICLAAAIVYFSYGLIKTVNEAPALITQVEQTAQLLDPVVAEVQNITRLLPRIIAEVALIREQVPPILAQVEKLRLELPVVISEVEQVRIAIPSILDEVAKVRETVPPILDEVAKLRQLAPDLIVESQGYRALVPDVLAEVKETREIIMPTMERAETLVADARVAGKEASEGAVSGFFTGFIKAPFKILAGTADTLFGSNNKLTTKDLALLEQTVKQVIDEGTNNYNKQWQNKKSGARGKVIFLGETIKDEKQCRLLRFEMDTKTKKGIEREATVCLDANNQWQVVN